MLTARLAVDDDGVLLAIRRSLTEAGRPVMLAVSGGLDSMVLLDAAARVGRDCVAGVASFDHRSGEHGRSAVALVRREAMARGLPVVVGESSEARRGEAAWRAARWQFLRRAANDAGAVIATAHTADDQIETLCMRVLRDSGARGLAGLLAPSSIRRPLLGFRRRDLERYARVNGVVHAEDPTNTSPVFLRNRLRHDLLPAIARVAPDFAATMLALGEDAARLRREVDAVAATLDQSDGERTAVVALEVLRGMTRDALQLIMPALAARAGVILDRRGTTRLSAFILKGRSGGRVQLSGGAEALLRRTALVIRAERLDEVSDEEIPLDVLRITGSWRFRRVLDVTADPWTAELPAESRLTVRQWRPGDRMRAAGARSARRVKRFLSDAGIAGADRIGWPVVLADGEIVWIPGVRRSDAATDRSGRPVLRYLCERNDV